MQTFFKRKSALKVPVQQLLAKFDASLLCASIFSTIHMLLFHSGKINCLGFRILINTSTEIQHLNHATCVWMPTGNNISILRHQTTTYFFHSL